MNIWDEEIMHVQYSANTLSIYQYLSDYNKRLRVWTQKDLISEVEIYEKPLEYYIMPV